MSKSSKKGAKAVRLQYGALPYRFVASGELQLLLVTSRERRRWIMPKGWPIKGLTPPKSAASEAFEEAGVRGRIGSKPIGRYRYAKVLADESGTIPCEVLMFELRVERQLEDWPEAREREKSWVSPQEAAWLIEEEGLRSILEAFVGRLSFAAPAAGPKGRRNQRSSRLEGAGVIQGGL